MRWPDSVQAELARLDAGAVLAARSAGGESFSAAWNPPGLRDLVDVDSDFYTASVTKQFTAGLVARVVLAGGLSESVRLRAVLPELPSWADDIELAQIVHHTSGLPPSSGLPGDPTNDDVLVALAHRHDLPRPPGSAFQYSNVGYVVLAEVLRRVAGRPFEDLIDEELLRPLHLGSASWSRTSWVEPQPPATRGDGGLWLNVGDLLTWLEHLNSDGFGPEFSHLVEQQGELHDGTPIDYAWGTSRRGHVEPYFTHGGDWPGWTAKTLRQPSTGVAVALLTRGASATLVTGVVQAIARHLGLEE